MNQPNGQAVSDLKKNASRVGNEIKSELKSDVKSAASKVERKASEVSDSVSGSSGSASSIADSVLASAISFLPVKNVDEVYSMLETTVKDVQLNLSTARDSATAFVKKYPLYSLLGAAVLGASAVMLFRKRGSVSADEIKYDA